MSLTSRIEADTPPDRDRYLDLLRAFSILMVVFGHWMVRVVTESDGRLERGYLLEIEPAWQWATLLWQVMPIFFLVGGLVNAGSWRRARDAGTRPVDWLRTRVRRLLFPLVPLLAILVPTAAFVHETVGEATLLFGFRVAVVPLWFLAAYLVVTALTPLTLAIHERGSSVRWLAICTLLAVAVDVLRFTVQADGPRLGTQPAIGSVNFLLVWVAIHQIGYLWADDQLPGGARLPWILALAGGGSLLLMIGSGLYPLTMVPIEGTHEPNNGGPPSAALIALGCLQLGVALLLREPISRLLARPRVWVPVALVSSRLMTVYLWHQAVMIAVANVGHPRGWLPVTAQVDATWWALRPLWILVCSVVLALVVLVVHRFETPPPGRPTRARGLYATLRHGGGVVLVAGGVGGLIATGLVQEAMPLGLPLVPLLALLLGLAALGVLAPPRRARD
jgi:peptidoglycan/LPS O-acetylase OafA/YrhL